MMDFRDFEFSFASQKNFYSRKQLTWLNSNSPPLPMISLVNSTGLGRSLCTECQEPSPL